MCVSMNSFVIGCLVVVVVVVAKYVVLATLVETSLIADSVQ